MSELADSLLDEAKAYCRIDGDQDDTLLGVLLDSAIDAVVQQTGYVLDESTYPELPSGIKLLVFILTSHWFDNRGVAGDPNELPKTFDFLALLNRQA